MEDANYDRAIKHLEEYVFFAPEDANGWMHLGNARIHRAYRYDHHHLQSLAMQDAELAADAFREAVKLAVAVGEDASSFASSLVEALRVLEAQFRLQPAGADLDLLDKVGVPYWFDSSLMQQEQPAGPYSTVKDSQEATVGASGDVDTSSSAE